MYFLHGLPDPILFQRTLVCQRCWRLKPIGVRQKLTLLPLPQNKGDFSPVRIFKPPAQKMHPSSSNLVVKFFPFTWYIWDRFKFLPRSLPGPSKDRGAIHYLAL